MFIFQSRYFVVFLALVMLMVFCTAYPLQRFPSILAVLSLLFLPLLVYSFYRLAKSEYRKHKIDETEKQQQPIIKKKFAEFAQTHGDLYEELTTPITDEDYKLFKRDYKRSIVLTGVFCLFLLSLIIVAFSYADNTEPAIIITLVVIVAMGVSLYFMYQTKKLLDKKEKFHIKGVISNKNKIPMVIVGERTRRIHTIEISERKNMTVTEKEYYQFTLGDIIHVEGFSSDGAYRRKIKLLGRI